jgi:hypothetical protein
MPCIGDVSPTENFHQAKDGLARVKGIIASVERQVNDGKTEIARLDARIKLALQDNNEAKADLKERSMLVSLHAGGPSRLWRDRDQKRLQAKSNFSLSMKRLADSTALSASALPGSPCGKSPSSVGYLPL